MTCAVKNPLLCNNFLREYLLLRQQWPSAHVAIQPSNSSIAFSYLSSKRPGHVLIVSSEITSFPLQMDGADGVYPPSEDTFLLVDALKLDEQLLKDATGRGGLCLEVGCGSGEVTHLLASILEHTVCYSADVNRLAVDKTQKLIEQTNLHNVELIMADMFTAFKPGTFFDIVVFNPPYVPTDQDEFNRALTTRDISASWAGGKDGREVIDKFLASLPPFLSELSLVYLVLLEENCPSQVATWAAELGLISTTVMKRKAGIETLYILRLTKDCSSTTESVSA